MMGNYYCAYCGKEISDEVIITNYMLNSPASNYTSAKYYHPACFEKAKTIYLTYDV
jgi:hypothetical protein